MRPVSACFERRAAALLVLVAALGSAAGCGGGGAVNTAPAVAPPPAATAPPHADQAPIAPSPNTAPNEGTTMASGWKYRFDMISPPNQNFGITTREVYLYFRPDTSSVGFRLENRLGVPIKILWDESTFLDVYGRSYKAVHRGVNYQNKDLPQEPTWVRPGETYADYIIPVDLLNSPEAAGGGGVRELLPTDLSAQSMVGRIFGPTLVLGAENDARLEFEVRFRVASVFAADR